MRFIGEHEDAFGVEPVCRVLSEHGWKIAPGTYYAAERRPPTRRRAGPQILAAIVRVRGGL